MQFIDIDPRLKELITTSPRHRALRKTRLAHVADVPTQEVPAITTRPMLPVDAWGRPYLLSVNSGAETLQLVEGLVTMYHRCQGCNPTIILLSALRYLSFGCVWHRYYPNTGDPIPYAYESGGYDVLVRGGR